jgi:hypothetical protein
MKEQISDFRYIMILGRYPVSKDTLTLKLTGEVPLSDFAQAVGRFSALVNALSSEISGNHIEWQIVGLESGSATAIVRGFYQDIEVVEKVVEAYSVVGEALENRKPIPYSASVANEAYALTTIIGGKVTGIQLITDNRQSHISEPLPSEQEPKKMGSIGTIIGLVETLSMRRNLRFILYDATFDRAVTCYIDKEQENIMRDLWGKQVSVTGKIFREPFSGKPVEIRNIKKITILNDKSTDLHKRAKGAIPWQNGDLLPEQIIRRIRDDQ